MNLHSGTPFWLAKSGLAEGRLPLYSPERCDVVVIGAGITGALVADALTAAGLDVVIVERRESGSGSTSASTALIQYEIDLELLTLREKLGKVIADRAYRASANAVARLATIASELEDCEFNWRHSLYLASTRRDAKRLESEVAARKSLGFDVEWWPRAKVSERYGFPSHGAIRSSHSGEINALALTRKLLERTLSRGARWYEQTAITGYEERSGGIRLFTPHGKTIDAKHAVCATGYDLPEFLPVRRTTLHTSYSIATERLTHFGPWDDRCLVWESARPYIYMRTTDDRRIIIGGEDVPFRDPAWRDRLLRTRTKALKRRLDAMLPSVVTETAFEWAGTFAETPDGLPYIGRDPSYPGILFALGYGGNGITFSVIAAEILSAECSGGTSTDSDLFRLDR